MFLKSIGNFRALAIILIVAGHLYSFGFVGEDVVSSVVKNIITGGTALFVFISGFMFHYIFYQKFQYKKFIVNKIKNVIVPYFLLSTFFILFLFLNSSGYFTDIEKISSASYKYMFKDGVVFNPNDSNFVTTIKYYLSGRVLTAYWYIPFVFLVFLSSPFHIKFTKLNLKNQIAIILLLSIVSILLHRPINNTNAIQSFVYYTPIYLIGIMVSMHSSKVNQYLRNKLLYLALFVFILSYLQYLLGHQGNYFKPYFEYDGVDLQYIQKVFLIFFFYTFFEKFYFESKLIDIISNTSFAIFFIHPWLIVIMYKIINIHDIRIESNNVLYYLFIVFSVIFVSIFSALILKKIFRVHSKKTRYIIGY